jgi:CRP/FNR family transcriptional regulator, cyclic AMP receptor protein
MPLKTIIRVLSGFHIFDGLTDEELKLFAGICEKSSFTKDEILVNEGHRGAAIYLITEGRVKVFLPMEIEGKAEHRISAINLNILKKSECFGEYSLIDHRPASASVIAMEPVELIKIPHARFIRIIETNDHIAKTIYHNILRILIARLREKDQEFDSLLIV